MSLPRTVFAVFTLLCLPGCAQRNLLEQERMVYEFSEVTSRSNLRSLAEHGERLALAYSEAARQASHGQDIAAVITYLAAASFVGGVVGSASDMALANRAMVGVGATSVARRTVSQNTIQGIYIASRRMNCIATTAQMGAFLLETTSPTTKGMARAATFGAIEDVRITTREALVRQVADFVSVRDDLLAGITLSGGQREGLDVMQQDPSADVDLLRLNQYLELLDNCLVNETDIRAVELIENPT